MFEKLIQWLNEHLPECLTHKNESEWYKQEFQILQKAVTFHSNRVQELENQLFEAQAQSDSNKIYFEQKEKECERLKKELECRPQTDWEVDLPELPLKDITNSLKLADKLTM